MLKLEQIKIDAQLDQERQIKNSICQILKIEKSQILCYKILRKTIDARRKNKVCYVYTLGVDLKDGLEEKFSNLKFVEDTSLFFYDKKHIDTNPVVVGFGPAGMFCALALARMGLRPIVIEQGKKVEDRQKDIQDFWTNGHLNIYSNVQFGEGGAGTFSDGKLNTNLSNDICKKLLYEFCHFGAGEDILTNAKPHIGSDRLKQVVKNIRTEIIKLGGTIWFSHKLVDINVQNDTLQDIVICDLKANYKKNLKTKHLILALGHSARDTFEMLYAKKINIKQKPFAMGVRIEQKQADINILQYGEKYAKILPNADYKIVTHLPNGRSVFSFCMCPGGYVVGSSSGNGEVVTNGMSDFARDNDLCNSALLVNILPQDFENSHPLAGIYFQAKYEKLAFELGGRNYNAPCQTVGNFLGKSKQQSDMISTYKPNVKFCEIENCLPKFVSESLKLGLLEFNKKLKNFAKDNNLLLAIESRSSCPLTIIRDENFESSIKGVYPIGEGAGYAGGIISSAQDGIKVAQSIYNKL